MAKRVVITGSTRGIGYGLAEAFLARQQILANEAYGAHIRWLTTPKIVWRFLSSPFRKRDVIGGKK